MRGRTTHRNRLPVIFHIDASPHLLQNISVRHKLSDSIWLCIFPVHHINIGLSMLKATQNSQLNTFTGHQYVFNPFRILLVSECISRDFAIQSLLQLRSFPPRINDGVTYTSLFISHLNSLTKLHQLAIEVTCIKKLDISC